VQGTTQATQVLDGVTVVLRTGISVETSTEDVPLVQLVNDAVSVGPTASAEEDALEQLSRLLQEFIQERSLGHESFFVVDTIGFEPHRDVNVIVTQPFGVAMDESFIQIQYQCRS